VGKKSVPFRRGVPSRFHPQGDRRCRRNRETEQQPAAILPDKLLDLLSENYTFPQINQRLTAKTTFTPDEFCRRLAKGPAEADLKVALTGSSSAGQYAVMAREPIQSFYCSNLERLLKRLGPDLEETSRFPNIELLETDEDFVYFDTRENLAASPVQTYVELVQGDKREQETAVQLRKTILQPLKKKG
jgi:hypothetical protein